TTRYTRPLPGAERLYPETDVKPITISEDYLKVLKKELPEPLTKKLVKLEKELRLPHDVAKQVLRSDYLEFFEKIVKTKKVEPILVATTFLQTLKDLKRREKVNIENLEEKHFVEVFDFFVRKKIVKEALPDILKYLAENPKKKVSDAIEELKLQPIGLKELRKIIKEIATQKLPFEKTYGIVMSRVRGRMDAGVVKKILKKYAK
ncbi:MAG: Glu-tRNA(Gln) amidotransferase GatDE subunit E, partial [Candidatus Aenigmarchaeota archaeon]|nr:Glu-tRNA(Gln) amidotransferase GatDE subunit E [Candidatus Aenigmarchaeota archaeon]